MRVDGSVLSVLVCRRSGDCHQCGLSTVLSRVSWIALIVSAPEHPFPTPFNDCFDAYTWVLHPMNMLTISLWQVPPN
jgi:hypothetical protein